MRPAALLGSRTLVPAVATFMDTQIEPVANSAGIPLPYIKVIPIICSCEGFVNAIT